MDDEIIWRGIANLSNLTTRLGQHRTAGLTELLHLVKFPTGHDARAMELLGIEYVRAHPEWAVMKDRRICG